MQKYPGLLQANGWQPTETKGALTRKLKTPKSKFPFIYYPTKGNGR